MIGRSVCGALGVCGVLAVLPDVAHAQDATPGAAAITVTGTPLRASPAAPAYDTQVLARAAIIGSASGRIEDVLADVAGFQQFRRSDSRSSNPSAQGATLRALGGNAASRTLVLLDGVPMADPLFGSLPFSALAPDRLAAIRVTRGGGSGAFGAGAVAGTIALESAGPDTLGLINAEALGDDRGETTLSASLAPHLGNGFAVVSGQWDRGEGFWTTPASQRVPASIRAAYDSWSAALRGVAAVAPNVELQARALVFDDQRSLRFAGADSNSDGGDFSLRIIGRGRWQFDALIYGQARDYANVVISASTYRKTLDQRSSPSTGTGVKLELRPPVGPDHLLKLGADWRRVSGDLAEDAFNAASGALTAHRYAGGRNGDLGLFSEDDWTLGTLVLTAGARADRWSIDDGYFRQTAPGAAMDAAYPGRAGWLASGRGGAVWHVGGGLALRASAYTGNRQPTLNELYRSFTVSPVTTQANPALVAEQLAGYEAGVDFAPNAHLRLTATAFYNRLAHAIANVTIGTNLQQRRNVDAIRARGIELGAGLGLGTWRLDASLALSDAVVDALGASLNGLHPAQTPTLAGSATLSWRPRAGWQLSATLRQVGSQFEDDLHTSVLPAATTLGANAQVSLRRGLSLVLRAENLTDAAVQTRNQAGSIDLAAPRTLWAGLRLGLR